MERECPAPACYPSPGQKQELRVRLLAARRARPVAQRQAAADRLHAAVAMLASEWVGRTVAGYQPMPTEPGGERLPAVLAEAVGPAGGVLLPVLRRDRDLDWTPYPGPDQPWAEPLPAPEPEPAPEPWPGTSRPETSPRQDLPPETITEASLLVVPAVAVDRNGTRLGRGGGSYDRVLARLDRAVPVVALLFDDELLDQPLPAEPHDRPVSGVITPGNGLVWLR